MLRSLSKCKFSPQMLNCVTIRASSSQNIQGQSGSSSSGSQNVIADVKGLSERCVKIPNTPVGPNAAKNKEYKNPEYFCYNVNSFAEAEVEMEKYRLDPPDNKEKFTRNL